MHNRTKEAVLAMLNEEEQLLKEGGCTVYFSRGHRLGWTILTDQRLIVLTYSAAADLIHPVHWKEKARPRIEFEIPLELFEGVSSKRQWRGELVTLHLTNGEKFQGIRFHEDEDEWISMLNAEHV